MIRRGSATSPGESAARAVEKSAAAMKNLLTFLTTADVESLNGELAGRLVSQAKRAEAIAFITVLHAAFEGFVFEMLRVCAHFKRDQVLQTLADRKISLASVQAHSLRQIEDEKVSEWLTQRLQKPLIENWRTLFSFAPPSAELLAKAPPYDEEWIKEFDFFRQDAVHHGGQRSLDVPQSQTLFRVRRIVEFLYMQVATACGIESSGEPEDDRVTAFAQAIAAIDSMHDRVLARDANQATETASGESGESGEAGEAAPNSL